MITAVTYTNFVYVSQASRAFRTDVWKFTENLRLAGAVFTASFAEEETRGSERWGVTCSKSHSWHWAKLRFEPESR